LGCLSFEYQTQGEWSFGQSEAVELLCKQELYKIDILKFKGKLKEPHSDWAFKLVSDINMLDTKIYSEQSSSFEADLNCHLYACSPKCNFMLMCKREGKVIVANGIMNLMMLGKFDKKITLRDMESNQQIGYLLVQTQCLKVDTVSVTFRNIVLTLENSQQHPGLEIMMKGEAGGCFGKT
jgi:hypothetical protein